MADEQSVWQKGDVVKLVSSVVQSSILTFWYLPLFSDFHPFILSNWTCGLSPPIKTTTTSSVTRTRTSIFSVLYHPDLRCRLRLFECESAMSHVTLQTAQQQSLLVAPQLSPLINQQMRRSQHQKRQVLLLSIPATYSTTATGYGLRGAYR